MSFQERKARLAQLKSRTECGDSACPKGGRKGGGKKSNKSSPTSSPTSSGKHGSSSGKTNKPRVVYFSMAEDEKATAQGPRVAMMAYRGARPKATSGGRAIPPPECLNAGAGTTPLSSPTTSPQSSSMAMATAPISMLSSLIPSIAADPGALPDREAIERAWMMQQQVRLEVAEQNSSEEAKPEAGSAQEDLGDTASPEDARVAGALRALAWTEVDEEGMDSDAELIPPPNIMATYFPEVGTAVRHLHLDKFLQAAGRDHPDWEDAYNERWTEFWPGHPMFVDSDLTNFSRWHDKAVRGEPKIPDEKQLSKAALLDGQPPGDAAAMPSPQSTSAPVAPITSLPAARPSAAPTTSAGCQHLKTTKKGVNKHVEMITCSDCHCVISKVKRTPSTATSTPQPQVSRQQDECPHARITWRGSNAFQWRQTCRDCGKMVCGFTGQAGPRQTLHQASQSTGSAGLPDSGGHAGQGDLTVEQMKNIFQTCHVVSCVKAMENPSQVLGGDQLHCILDAVVASTQAQTFLTGGPTKPQAEPPSRPKGFLPHDSKLLSFGEFKGRTFEHVFRNGLKGVCRLLSRQEAR